MQATEERDAAGAAAAAASVAADPDAAPAPVVLDRYHLMRRLGSGGFGTVHEAWDERLERWVAVKVIPSDGTAPERARREARAVARLDHPNVVALHDAGEEPGARYLVCELVDGATMAELQADRRLGDRDVLRIGLAMADALEHAHERGVVHRDVKPQNVLVPRPPGGLEGFRAGAASVLGLGDDHPGATAAKLTDFGVAHLAGEEAITRTGDVLGTLAYMAPEQAAGAPADARVDLYGLALLVYEGLADVHPVKAGNAAATARRLGTVLPSLAEHRPDLPPGLAEAVDAALLPDPEDRGTLAALAMAMADALPGVRDQAGTIAPHPIERRLAITPAHTRLAAGAATGLLAGVAVQGLSPDPALDALTVAAAAALLTALLPRAGWIATLLAVAAAIVTGPAPRAGAATVLLAALLPVPLLLRRAPVAWTLPLAAPVLGLVGAAPAFAALAGRARTAGRRAVVGALGLWCTILAEPLVERALLTGAPQAVPPRTDFDGGVSLAVQEVLDPLVSSGALLLAPVWASFAVVLPWVVRGRAAVLDVPCAIAWAAGLVAASAAVARGAGIPEPGHPGLAGVGAAVLALAGGAAAAARRPDRI